MPALVTHRLFGEQALGLLPDTIRATEAQRAAFLLANQGPDPFFFAVTSPRGSDVRAMGHRMHSERMSAAFDTLRAGVGLLPTEDQPVGQAFACGLLAHYVLDRTAHPFVYAFEYELCDNDPELADAYHEVHALIESEIDAALLLRLRGATVADVTPALLLQASPEVLRPAGALLAQCAMGVFDLPLRCTDYQRALANMRLCYRVIEPAGSPRSRALGALERTTRAHSQLEALAHRCDVPADAPAMNEAHREWVCPFSGERSHDSFADRFTRALRLYELAIRPFVESQPASQITQHVDYSGRRLGIGEQPAADNPARPV